MRHWFASIHRSMRVSCMTDPLARPSFGRPPPWWDAEHDYRQAPGLREDQDKRNWSVAGGAPGLLLVSIDEVVRAAGYMPEGVTGDPGAHSRCLVAPHETAITPTILSVFTSANR